METKIFISLALLAWGLQIYFGWRQIQQFNHFFSDFCHQHSDKKITLGRSKGRFKPKVLVVFAIDNENSIQDHFVLQGFSIFAKPQKLPQLAPRHLKTLIASLDDLFPKENRLKEAIKEALTQK